jgi:glutaconate CoA-transferase subunit B
MTVVAARELRDRTVCFVGIGLPSTAANLARRLHAPDIVLVYESGCHCPLGTVSSPRPPTRS